MGLKICKKYEKCLIPFLLVVLGLVVLFLFRNAVVFLLFLVGNALLNYYQGRMEFPFDLTPSFVLVILFSIKLGFGFGLAFLLLGSVIPSVIAAGFDHTTFMYVTVAAFLAYVASLGLIENTIIYGNVLIIIQSIFSFFIATFSDEPAQMFSVFLGLILNFLYFIALNNLFSLVLV